MSLGVYKSTFHRVTTQRQLHWLKVLLKKKNKRKRASRIQSGSLSVSEPTSTRKLDWHVYVLWLGYPLKWPCNTTLRDFQRCASLRTMHMSYRSKTYTWNDAIRVKRSMIRGFFLSFSITDRQDDLVLVIYGSRIFPQFFLIFFLFFYYCLWILKFAFLYSFSRYMSLGNDPVLLPSFRI